MRTARWRALAAFAALTIPFGIVAHLASEFFGLGWRDDADVAFSLRHLYLAILALASLAALAFALRTTARAGRSTAVADLIAALPLRGRGARFIALSFLSQFAFFAITQIGEGAPLQSGNVALGIAAAAVAALAGAIAVAVGKRRVLDLALSLVWFVEARRSGDSAVPLLEHRTRRVPPRAKRRAPYAFRYRPPPALRPNFFLT